MKNKWLYFPHLLLIIVALNSIFFGDPTLSRWKGGAYGMYSDVHPKSRSIWITVYSNTIQGEIELPLNVYFGIIPPPNQRTYRLLRMFAVCPQCQEKKNWFELFKQMGLKGVKSVKIYEPTVDLMENTLQWNLIYSANNMTV
jgi:hypothetical protein